MKKLIIVFLTISLFLGLIAFNAAGQYPVDTTKHDISIEMKENKLFVEEKIDLIGSADEPYEHISFYIQNGATNINVLFNNNPIEDFKIDKNIYTFNLTSLNILVNQSLSVTLSYELPISTMYFTKKLVHTTQNISVSFDKYDEIYSSDIITQDGEISLKLYKPTETPISWYIIAVIILLLILLSVTLFYSFRKQRSSKISKEGSESEEFLLTKKTLLMSLLKEIEKQHRAKKISDDTYHKLKSNYKNEAVDAMKKLDDIKSKVK